LVNSPIVPEFLIRGVDLTVERAGRRLINSVSLTIAPGRIITLVGPNGAGKTTLIRVLLGLLPPDAGKVERQSGLVVGYVPQRFHVPNNLPMSVDTFLHLAGRGTALHRHEILERLAANHLRHASLHNLSGGELQRVLLARALLRQPDLLVLDEPAQGLDLHGERELYRLIAGLRDEQGCAVLMISHDLHLVMAATDEVICLERHICCTGKPEDISRHPEYLRMFGPGWEGLAFYQHRHDHHHDLHGDVVPDEPDEYRHGERPRKGGPHE